ncbi:MAG TPA: hypothetical protein ACHBZ9_19265 [Arsenophonus nasoniae]
MRTNNLHNFTHAVCQISSAKSLTDVPLTLSLFQVTVVMTSK